MPIKNKYKILVVGAGSIGSRHIKNLKTLGVEHIGIVDPVRGLPSYTLKEALKEKWDSVFICSPSSMHLKIALEVAKVKIPMFIEKPLSHGFSDLAKLQSLTKDIKPIMVGYNMDFHPQFKKIKALLKKKILGKVWGARAEFGQYLPDWHPKEDYSKGYSARKELGGGILLDDIHEINLLYNLFGPVKKVSGFSGKQSDLKINTEDYVEMILQFQSGVVGQIHMDYLQRDSSRSLKIIGEKGTLIWDLKKAKIEIYKSQSKTLRQAQGRWEVFDEMKNYDWNETYLGETKEFLKCLKAKKNPDNDLQRGIDTLRIALKLKIKN